MSRISFGVWAAMALILAPLAGAQSYADISQQTETVIHVFPTGPYDGAQSYSALVADPHGALYGTTYSEGAYDFGNVYQLTHGSGGAWNETILYSFKGGSDGKNPYGALFLSAKNHKIYGTTYGGGSGNLGVVYELDPPAQPGAPWTETVLHTFEGTPDGAYPYAGVVADSEGALYGTTSAGGTSYGGIVFRLLPPSKPGGVWKEEVLHDFAGTPDTNVSLAHLVFDNSENLYGTGSSAGEFGYGAAFELSPPSAGNSWSETILYSFTGGSDGGDLIAGLVFDSTGDLYGTALIGGDAEGSQGSGTVFELSPPAAPGANWTENTLHTFKGGTDGRGPFAGVIVDNNGFVYGTTLTGGDSACETGGCGTAFALQPPSGQGGAWTERVLHAFAGGNDGVTPLVPLLQLHGNLYGTTVGGGSPSSLGTVFEITP